MQRPPLRDTLGLIVALAAGCGGKLASTGSDSASTSEAPGPLPDECPHVVEIRSFDLSVPTSEACSLAASAPGCFSFACQPAAKPCAVACGDPLVNACSLPNDYLSEYKLALAKAGAGGGDAGNVCPPRDDTVGLPLHCAVSSLRGTKSSGCPVEGRRPAGLRGPSARTSESVSAYLAQSAWLEAVSVQAFDDLAEDLARLGAPRAISEACRQAAHEERRHAALVGALVVRFGGASDLPSRAARRPRSAFDLALENAVEGEIRETFGAADALFRARNARDPFVRAAMIEIAEDECRHAELAASIAGALEPRLSLSERHTVAQARFDAVAELADSFQVDAPDEVRHVLGVPAVAEARSILAELTSRVWSMPSAA